MHVLSFCYGTHEPMQAWLQEPPADGKLKIKMAISPSSHAGGDRATKTENYKKFARENVYNLRVVYPDGKTKTVQFNVDGEDPKTPRKDPNKEVFSTISPEVEIDLKGYEGQQIKVEGWANGSAGVHGYIEKRQTVINVPE